jgi:ABC-type multidrug transport system fused ATPase/permease subunit
MLLGRRTVTWLAIAIVASLVLAGVELLISLFLQVFLKSLGIVPIELHTPLDRLQPTATTLGIALATVALVRSTAQFFVGQSSSVSMETINARIRRVAVWEMLLHPSRRIVAAGAVNARVGDLAAKSSYFCYAGASFVSYAVQAIGLAAVMFLTSGQETLIALAGLGVVGLGVLRVNRVARKIASGVPAELRVLTEGIERVARNVSLVRILRTQGLEHRRLSTAIDRYASRIIHGALLGNIATVMAPFVGVLLILVVVWVSQSWLHTPGLMLVSFLYLFVRFVAALTNATYQFSSCNTAWPAFADSLAYVGGFRRDEIASAMRVGEALVGRVMERPKSSGGAAPDVEVRGLVFRYPGSSQDVLTGVSLHVPAGSQLAIIGPSGCGKSTLLALLLGLFDPAEGTIHVGGRSPAAYFDDPATRVGYVGAEAFLIAGSVRENMRYGLAVEAADADLWQALEQASLRETVEQLPGDLDYVIAEDGSGLSAGQKQRLCLARAMLNRPHILVLDEASANLDAVTEDEIARSVGALHGSCTTIVVSHRPRMIRLADEVVTLESEAARPTAPGA